MLQGGESTGNQQYTKKKRLKVCEAMETKRVLHPQSLAVDATILHQITSQMGSFR